MNDKKPIPRRTFLRGAGTVLALPFFEAMLPTDLVMGRAFGASSRSKYPRRMAFFYVPNGVRTESWTPKGVGKLPSNLPTILAPMKPFRSDFMILSGLTQDGARAHGDGPGDHARAAAAFLTGEHPYKTGGKDIRIGISVDQYAAQRIGDRTPFRSLEIGGEGGRQSGSCDSGYSCAYSHNISWKTESLPMAKETDPRQLFDRLFPNIANQEADLDRKYRKSVLDVVLDDARKLDKKLGKTDSRKLDEYLTAVHEIEGRLKRAEKDAKTRKIPRSVVKFAGAMPDTRPSDLGERVRLLGDILVLAFQTDLTRIATFMFTNEGSNRSYPQIGVPDGHHDVSHHGKKEDKLEKYEKINVYHMEQFAYIVKRLKDTREGSRSLLDHCMLVYGSGISDGNRHNHNELPILVAGKGGGSLKPGRHIQYSHNTPLNNLYVSMLERMGVKCDKLGDSKGPLAELS